MEPFRTRQVETVETQPEKPADVTGIVDDPFKMDVFSNTSTELENWETTNGKYGLQYLGIKELGKQFPFNTQFSTIDKYIKEEMGTRGYDKTPQAWQDILSELEDEVGSKGLNAVERLRKLSSLVNIIRKQNFLKAKRELYKTLILHKPA